MQRYTIVGIAIDGESASGKSTLMDDVIIPALRAQMCRVRYLPPVYAAGMPRERIEVLMPAPFAQRDELRDILLERYYAALRAKRKRTRR